MNNVEKIPIVCPYCGFGCRIYAIKNGNRIKLEFVRDIPTVNQGSLCPKGLASLDYVLSRDRLKTPLKVSDRGKFSEISWKKAIEIVSKNIKEMVKKHGPDSLGFISSAKCTNEENFLMQKIARMLGTNNVDHCARLCHASTVVGLAKTVGAAAQSGSYLDIPKANAIMIWGYNPAETHPVVMKYILAAKDNGARIILVDPRRTKSGWFADYVLRLIPGSDVALANAIMNVIISENLYDDAFVSDRLIGFEQLADHVMKYSPENVEKITGVDADLIRDAARTFAQAGRGIIMWGMGVTQHINGTDLVVALSNIALICGYVGKEGTGLFPMRGQANVQGACDMGALPNVLPGYAKVGDAEKRKVFENHWGVKLPSEVGLTIPEMIEGLSNGKVAGLYIMGENPVISDPDIDHVIKSLQNSEFLVVQDLFITETAELADVILPAAAFAEKEGSFTASERRVQWTFKVLEPPGEARPDWYILKEVAKALDLKGFEYSCPEDVLREINALVPQYRGITPERLKANIYGLQWPCPSEDHPGTPRLHVDVFPTKSGKGYLIPVELRGPAENPDKDYPFILTTVRVVGQFHTRTMSKRSPLLEKRWKEPFAEINDKDAEKLGIKTGDKIRIITRRGSYECKAFVTKNIVEGTIAVPWHWGANILTNTALDPEAKIPELKVAACRVEKIS